MVEVFRIAHLHALHCGLRQFGLDTHDGLGFFLCGSLIVAQQVEHLCDVFLILLACFLGLGIVTDVIIAIREPQSSLGHTGDYHAGVVQIGLCAEAKKRLNSQRVQVSDGFNDLIFGLDSGNAIQFGLQRSRAFFVYGLLIHAGSVIVADFLLDG